MSAVRVLFSFFFFFFNDTATTEIYTLSLHDALPIFTPDCIADFTTIRLEQAGQDRVRVSGVRDRKSTRLNSSHLVISYAVFCLKKKKTTRTTQRKILVRTNTTGTTHVPAPAPSTRQP